jgi:hypothetical protein
MLIRILAHEIPRECPCLMMPAIHRVDLTPANSIAPSLGWPVDDWRCSGN